MPKFDDINVLLDDLAAYAARTGHTILCADDPVTRSFGFVSLEDSTVDWTIGLRSFRESLGGGARDARMMSIVAAFQTSEGRQRLASAISRTGDVDAALPLVATEAVTDPVQACLEPPQRLPMPTVPEPRPMRTAEERLCDDDLLPSKLDG